jgi:hypothetical protein
MHDPFLADLHTEETFMNLDMDLNNNDLSEWLDIDHHQDSNIVTSEDQPSSNLEFAESVSFNEDDFEDCNQEMDDEDTVVDTHKSYHSLEREPMCPPTPNQTKKDHFQPPFPVTYRGTQGTTPVAVALSSLARDESYYNIAMSNLESSMRKSEYSRAQVLQHRQVLASRSPVSSSPLPSHSGVSTSLADLFSGKRTTLTRGLEQSRNQLRMYLTLINRNQPF